MATPDPRQVFPEATFGAIRDVAQITGGMSGAPVFAVETETGRFVVRFHVPAQGEAVFQRTVAAYRAAAEQGVAPPLVHVDSQRMATVSVRIEGVSLGQALADPAARANVLGSLARQLTTLHATPLPEGAQVKTPVATARDLWNAQSVRTGFPAWARSLGDRIDRIAAALVEDPRLVFSHCDPHPANLLWDGQKVWLVDWEGAGAAHPYLDLAALANFFSLPDAAAESLLALQEGELAAPQIARFRGLRDLARLIYGNLFLSGVPDLAAVRFASREATPGLSACFASMARGELSLGEPAGGAAIGAAFLSQMAPE